MTESLDRRRSGILLHITSLSGPFAQGVLGEEAHVFIDQVADAGFSVWQFLPLGPTHGHGSPYESLSSFAGNPDFLDLRDCVERDWLSESTCHAVIEGECASDIARAEASVGFWQHVAEDDDLNRVVQAFLAQNSDWLDDYALFAALKKAYQDQPWWLWPDGLKNREAQALTAAREKYGDNIHQVLFEQFLFAHQWQQLKKHAEEKNIELFGDIPIYVAHDSADVWTYQEGFTINESGLCDEVAGVPPDYFSENGQRWGNPLYHWETMKNDGFSWWIKRVSRQLLRMHLIRIDHFRGLEAYWAIPGDRHDGKVGEWRKAPGEALLATLEKELGTLPLIAEDLGLITPEVDALRKQFKLPGMKILQFSFGGEADNPYLPHNHEIDSVSYTGTHDNDTTLGWFNSTSDEVRHHVREYLNTDCDDMPWPIICATLASVANLAIIPMQDLLTLGGEARMNTPGTIESNWDWRLNEPISSDLIHHVHHLNRLYGR
ncbi:MAG: 4-alpha-glucanotransferase [Mariprofundaceae bacterium]